MSNSFFSFTPSDFDGIQDYERAELEAQMKGKQPFFSGEEMSQVYPLSFQSITDSGFTNSARSNAYGAYQKEQDYFFKDQANLNSMREQEVRKSENITSNSNPFSLISALSLLNNYGSGIKKLNLNQCPSNPTLSGTRTKLSTEEIMRVAGARYIQFSDQKSEDFAYMHPFGYALSGLSEEEVKDVELAHLLLAAAEKVGYEQYDRASRLLSRCEQIASERANPVQRVIHSFAEALLEKIDKATGNFTPIDRKAPKTDDPHGFTTNLACLTVVQKVPFNQITQLASIQCIMENIGSARKLHAIDFEIRSGVQWTGMMQALLQRENRPLEHLTVTSIGDSSRSKQLTETGKRLESFAKSMNLSFKYRVICFTCPSEIKEELFRISGDEAVVVVLNLYIRTLIFKPECLEKLMTVIKNLNPSLVIVFESEANHSSPIFVNRFVEALFFYSAYFDCLDVCLKQNVEELPIIEAIFSHGIRETVALPNKERVVRSVKIDVWRAFFSRFRMVEIGFSESCLYQASLVTKQFACGNLCTLDKNGKCLLVGWKGTPLHSLSAWKFSRDRLGRFPSNYRR
ncbi:DELLA protein RGL2 [Euphorbia peplus]|nr:DELLA protein RGL2 [Euphorbia peplus]